MTSLFRRELGADGKPVMRDGKSIVTLDWWAFQKSVFLGVLAAFAVPLFLVLSAPGASDSIITKLMTSICVSEVPPGCTESKEWWSNLLVLIGFCIVAALAAQRFLQTLTERVLKEAKDNSIEARHTAAAARADSQAALAAARNLGPTQELNDTAINVLKAFVETSELPATAEKIAEQAQLEVGEVSDTLNDLEDGGLVVRDEETGAWRLRGWGMMRARKEVGLGEQDIRLLSRIKSGQERRPTAEALSESISGTAAETTMVLKRLERLGLVAPSKGEPGGWRIRSWGKVAVKEALST